MRLGALAISEGTQGFHDDVGRPPLRHLREGNTHLDCSWLAHPHPLFIPRKAFLHLWVETT